MRSRHADCQNKRENARRKVSEAIRLSVKGASWLAQIQSTVAQLADAGRLHEAEVRAALADGWSAAVDDLLDDGLLDSAEEQRLSAVQQVFNLAQEDLDKCGKFTSVVQAGILRDVANGKLPARVTVAGGIPVNLQKSESIIWAFRNVEMLEDQTRRQYVG